MICILVMEYHKGTGECRHDTTNELLDTHPIPVHQHVARHCDVKDRDRIEWHPYRADSQHRRYACTLCYIHQVWIIVQQGHIISFLKLIFSKTGYITFSKKNLFLGISAESIPSILPLSHSLINMLFTES